MAGHGKGRLLTVAGMRYRWNLRKGRKLEDGQQYLLLTVVGSETTRQALHVLLRHDNVWLHFSDLAHSGQAAEELGLVIRSIKPRLVARVIELAREAGWDASRPGPTLEFVFVDDTHLKPLAARP